MPPEAWLPIRFELPDGARNRRALYQGKNWQIIETIGGGRALVARMELADRWAAADLIGETGPALFSFGDDRFWSVSSGPSQVMAPVNTGRSPDSKNEALAFALALKATRELDSSSPLQDGLYVERISRVLPTYSISSATDDDVVLGYWLTGGASISVTAFRRLSQTMSWLGEGHLRDVLEAAGFPVPEPADFSQGAQKAGRFAREENSAEIEIHAPVKTGRLELPGRPKLEEFFNQHIVDIVRNQESYKRLGIGSPAPVILCGPPGCGKTFAAERLIDYLEWPSFSIDASSVASPYIHETSRKVAEIFEKAMEHAPAVLVIDEMEAFLSNRDSSGGHHRVEEVAEFLKRIPEASKNGVLILAMTNRVDMIDPAVLRRGRFDHVVEVGYASESEVLSLLDDLLSTLPKAENLDPRPLAAALANRPLSDVAFVVREGARLAARAGRDSLDQESLAAALASTPIRASDSQRRIGFV